MKLLLIAWFDPKGINAIVDHVEAIQKLSSHSIEILNTFDWKFKLHSFIKFPLAGFDGIILHNTVTYNTSFMEGINKKFQPSLQQFEGIKILMKQDEMRRVNDIKKIIFDWNINVLSTCLDSENVSKVYGDLLKRMRVVHTLTGYVTEEMLKIVPRPLEDRELDVVYRGMETPFEWGTLGYEKYSIGEKFKDYTKDFNLRQNISSLNKDRIYGPAWIDFLSSSRATLAVESGASIFDFDGTVEQECADFRKKFPHSKFEDAYNSFLHAHERDIKYNQISPRHIEATALGTVQIMFEGNYSGIYKPYVHYIPLKKDFSNIVEAVELLKDLSYCKKITDDSRKDILLKKDLTFDHFVKELDQVVSKP